MPTVYELNAYLYGFDSLVGQPAQMEYLPSPRCRKWRRGFYVKSYSEIAYTSALRLLQSGEIASFRFVSA